jgi:hypothetical protein
MLPETKFAPCALPVGALRKLCGDQRSPLAVQKLHSVRHLDPATTVVVPRAEIEELGGAVTIDHRFAADPVKTTAADVCALCTARPSPETDRLYKLAAAQDPEAMVVLDRSTAEALAPPPPKSETRNPKPETNPKSEIRKS